MIRWMVSILSDYYLVQRWLQITNLCLVCTRRIGGAQLLAAAGILAHGMQSLQPAIAGNSNLREEEER
jgi:hypothetical protein